MINKFHIIIIGSLFNQTKQYFVPSGLDVQISDFWDNFDNFRPDIQSWSFCKIVFTFLLQWLQNFC